jgi:hypothetical protein
MHRQDERNEMQQTLQNVSLVNDCPVKRLFGFNPLTLNGLYSGRAASPLKSRTAII